MGSKLSFSERYEASSILALVKYNPCCMEKGMLVSLNNFSCLAARTKKIFCLFLTFREYTEFKVLFGMFTLATDFP